MSGRTSSSEWRHVDVGTSETFIQRDTDGIRVLDAGGVGPRVLLLHGLAGSSRELLSTGAALTDEFHVLLLDQRGHGKSDRNPSDLSRQAFVADTVAVIERLITGERVHLVGQSMGGHTALLTASSRPDLVRSLVMLEGHAEGNLGPDGGRAIGAFFKSWPVPFEDRRSARAFLGDGPLATAWIKDLESTEKGLMPRFDPLVMQEIAATMDEPRWSEWEALACATTAIFASDGMFDEPQKAELIERRPQTRRVDLDGASHDAHLDAFESWLLSLRRALGQENKP